VVRVLQLPVPSAPDELVLAAQAAVRAVADAPLGGDAAGQVLVLLGMRAVLESAVAARLRVVEHSQAYAVDGSVTVTSWVDTRARCGRTEAARTVGLARRLDRYRLVAAALAAGELTVGHAQVLGRALDVLPEHLRARQEPLFVAVARLTDPHTLGVELRKRTGALDADGADRAEDHDLDRNRVQLSKTLGGRWHLRGGPGPAVRRDPSCRAGRDPPHRPQRRGPAQPRPTRRRRARSPRPASPGPRRPTRGVRRPTPPDRQLHPGPAPHPRRQRPSRA